MAENSTVIMTDDLIAFIWAAPWKCKLVKDMVLRVDIILEHFLVKSSNHDESIV